MPNKNYAEGDNISTKMETPEKEAFVEVLGKD